VKGNGGGLRIYSGIHHEILNETSRFENWDVPNKKQERIPGERQ
jgi:hypothetical protein